METFKCPKCGYKNYLDESDLDRMHVEAARSLRDIDKYIARQNRKWWRRWCMLRLAFTLPRRSDRFDKRC